MGGIASPTPAGGVGPQDMGAYRAMGAAGGLTLGSWARTRRMVPWAPGMVSIRADAKEGEGAVEGTTRASSAGADRRGWGRWSPIVVL